MKHYSAIKKWGVYTCSSMIKLEKFKGQVSHKRWYIAKFHFIWNIQIRKIWYRYTKQIYGWLGWRRGDGDSLLMLWSFFWGHKCVLKLDCDVDDCRTLRLHEKKNTKSTFCVENGIDFILVIKRFKNRFFKNYFPLSQQSSSYSRLAPSPSCVSRPAILRIEAASDFCSFTRVCPSLNLAPSYFFVSLSKNMIF